MPSEKRRRPTSPAINEGAAHPKPFSLDGFHLIPVELQQLIISFACLQWTSSSRLSLTPFAATDTATALSFCIVNREIGQWAQRLLYRDVSITRPSVLYALEQTLTANPALGKLIQRLQLGPQDILPAHWWPLCNAYAEGYSDESPGEDSRGGPCDWIATSLEKAQLPTGYGDRHHWAIVPPASASCREQAINKAIKNLTFLYNTDLRTGVRGESGQDSCRVGRILEVQGALDLYLARLRAVEQDNPHLLRLGPRTSRISDRCKQGACKHYPPLAIMETAFSLEEGTALHFPAESVWIPHTEVLRHLARAGALTDRFDHPILFSRSGCHVHLNIPPGQGHPGYNPQGAAPRYWFRSRRWDTNIQEDNYDQPLLDPLRREDEKHVAAGRPALNRAAISTATLDGNLRLAESVLSLTPNLRGLSLTGFLTGALSPTSALGLSSLKRLSLGPLPVSWGTNLSLHGLVALEDLRIAGTPLTTSNVQVIKREMPRLRRIDWSMKESSSTELSIAQTVKLLLESSRDDGAGLHSQSVFSSTAKQVTTDEDSQQLPEDRSLADPTQAGSRLQSTPSPTHSPSCAMTAPLTVVARLPPADLSKILAAAPSEETRAEWKAGRTNSASGPSHLLLLEQRLPEGSDSTTLRPSQDSTSYVWREFYEEAREWWSAGGWR